MKISRRWNKFWIGLSIGVFLPLLFFLLIYLIGYSKSSIEEFLRQTIMMLVLPKILSLCVVPNLAVFYFFLNKEFWYTVRGVITATLLCTLAVVVIKLLI